eukprot:GHUV01035320.1.p1 GENE.GHUV01035320.1~~GHUV01035320.1.p1  ORF type:complete len:106 (+),score=19.33 GHUV01035320.1:242-559(+)
MQAGALLLHHHGSIDAVPGTVGSPKQNARSCHWLPQSRNDPTPTITARPLFLLLLFLHPQGVTLHCTPRTADHLIVTLTEQPTAHRTPAAHTSGACCRVLEMLSI